MFALRSSGAVIGLALAGLWLAGAAASCSTKQRAPSEPFAWAKDEPTTTPVAPTTPPPPASTCEGCSTRGMTVMPNAPDPEALKAFMQSLGGPGVAFATASGAPRITEAALHNTSLGAAFGMKPAGNVEMATLREGERASRQVSVAAGECAAFVAQGGLGTIEIDMFLVQGGGASPQVIAQDAEPGPMAVIGQGECIRGAGGGALSAELHVRLRRGEGIVLIQGFRKPQ